MLNMNTKEIGKRGGRSPSEIMNSRNSEKGQTICTVGAVNRTLIDGMQRQTNKLEKKIDWLFYAIITTLMTVITNLFLLVGG